MKKAKLFSIILATIMVVSSVFVLVACNTRKIDDTILKEYVEAGQKMTDAQLLAEAKKETGEFVAYGNTSRITTAMDNFIEKYGEELGISGNKASKLSDGDIYKKLQTEATAASKNSNASVVLIQDSAMLMQYRNSGSMLTNYIPMGMEDKVDDANLMPLAHQFINKLFMYNTTGDTNRKFTNVWQLTEASYKNKIFFKDPTTEQVNMNFLIMLTGKDWSKKLETAYKAWNDGKAATDVGKGKTYQNYGYKWIAEFIANCNFSIGSDTTIAQKLSTTDNADKMGLFVLSKLRDSSVYGDNLQVSAWDKEEGASDYTKIEPFAGFMYSIYAQLATNGPRPYTAMLFINYLMTEEGFTPWKSLGGYSANKDVPVYSGSLTTPKQLTDAQKAVGGEAGKSLDNILYKDNNKAEMKLVKSESVKINGKDVTIKTYMYLADGTTITDLKTTDGKATKVTVDGKEVDFKASVQTTTLKTIEDSPLSFWAENLVVEDGAYILSVKVDVEDWINKQLSGK